MLNFNNSPAGGGNYVPYIRYMASTSSWSTSDGPFQFSKAAFDLANIKTGWCLLAEGQAPEWVMDETIEKTAARPEGEGWKRGFKVNIMSAQMFGDEEPVREWGTNATGAVMGIQKLWADWQAQGEPADQVAVVEFAGAVPTKVGKGNTNVPTLNIVKLIDRPAELADIAEPEARVDTSSLSAPAASAPSDDDEF